VLGLKEECKCLCPTYSYKHFGCLSHIVLILTVEDACFGYYKFRVKVRLTQERIFFILNIECYDTVLVE